MINIGLIIESAQNYFDEITQGGFSSKTPFILQRSEGVSDYILEVTATITISGQFDGALYVTLPRNMLVSLVEHILGECTQEDDLVDMAGELVNTITGNLRQNFGEGFVISVPMVIRGENVHIDLPRLVSPIYLVPCSWQGFDFYLCVGLDKISGL